MVLGSLGSDFYAKVWLNKESLLNANVQLVKLPQSQIKIENEQHYISIFLHLLVNVFFFFLRAPSCVAQGICGDV